MMFKNVWRLLFNILSQRQVQLTGIQTTSLKYVFKVMFSQFNNNSMQFGLYSNLISSGPLKSSENSRTEGKRRGGNKVWINESNREKTYSRGKCFMLSVLHPDGGFDGSLLPRLCVFIHQSPPKHCVTLCSLSPRWTMTHATLLTSPRRAHFLPPWRTSGR